MLKTGISPLINFLSGADEVFTADDFRALVERWKQDSASGLICFSANGDDTVLFFYEGKCHCVYDLQSGTEKPVGYDDILNSATNFENTRSTVLPILGLLIARLVVEGKPQSENIPFGGLSAFINMFEKQPLPVLLELSRDTYFEWLVIPGGGLSLKDMMIFDGNQFLDGGDALKRINYFESGCVARYYNYTETGAWIEYILRYIFTLTTEQILNRAAELTGRVMVDSIVRDVNTRCAAENLDISVVGSRVQNKAMFKTPVDAVAKYRFILDLIIRHIETVIGSGLTLMVVRQIVAGFTDLDLELLKRYPIIQEDFLGFLTGPIRLK
jgi:hypothetical protein